MSYGNNGGFDAMSQPPKKSNTLWWVLGIIGVLTVGGALLCCGGIYFTFRFVSDAIGEQVKLAVSQEPVIQEHIGTISDMGMNFTATSQTGGGGNQKFVFDVVGDKGTGQLEVLMDTREGQQAIESCVLVLPNGDRHEITIQPAADTTVPEVTEGEPMPDNGEESPEPAPNADGTEEPVTPEIDPSETGEPEAVETETETADAESAVN
jgi:hypothetical protein